MSCPHGHVPPCTACERIKYINELRQEAEEAFARGKQEGRAEGYKEAQAQGEAFGHWKYLEGKREGRAEAAQRLRAIADYEGQPWTQREAFRNVADAIERDSATSGDAFNEHAMKQAAEKFASTSEVERPSGVDWDGIEEIIQSVATNIDEHDAATLYELVRYARRLLAHVKRLEQNTVITEFSRARMAEASLCGHIFRSRVGEEPEMKVDVYEIVPETGVAYMLVGGIEFVRAVRNVRKATDTRGKLSRANEFAYRLVPTGKIPTGLG